LAGLQICFQFPFEIVCIAMAEGIDGFLQRVHEVSDAPMRLHIYKHCIEASQLG